MNYPDALPLAVDVRPEDGTIVDVGPYRHRVVWVDSGPSSCTYCNHCGSALSLAGRVKAAADPQQPAIIVCAGCRRFQGFQ